MKPLSSLSVDELADGICLRAGRIAAAQAELLPWIAEFDRREGWGGVGMLSCAHWLSWRAGMSLGTARDQVRVAHRLEQLPELAAAFGEGRVSYSKVRAITRVAEPVDGIDWVDLARHCSAAQLDKIVRGVHRVHANEQASADPELAAWRLRTRIRYDDRGGFTMTISGPVDQLPVVRAGLDAKKAELQRERDAAATEAAEAAAHTVAEEPAEKPEPAPEPAAEAGGTSEGPPPAATVGSTAQVEDDEDLDQQVPGWPPGTTGREVREAMDSFAALTASLRADRLAIDAADADAADAAPSPAPLPVSARRAPATAVPDAPADPPRLEAVTDADALLALAQDALEAEQAAHPDVARRRRPQLTAQVDPLSGWARLSDGELLPPSSLRQVMKTLPGHGGLLRLRPVTEADLRRADLGRTRREANAALRELLATLDGERCRFPGCTRHKKLHAHHVMLWSDGGPTNLDNLVLVCSRHHTLIHAEGFQLVLHPDRRLEVRTADGVRLLHHPAQPWGDPAALAAGCGQLVSAETLPPDHAVARLDLRYVVSVLTTQAA